MIHEKATELGRLIGQTDDYRALRRAREELEQVSEIRAQLQRVELVTQHLEESARQGREPEQAAQDEYEQLLSSIQAHPKYQQVVAAQANFDKLMLKVNEHMVDGMRQGAQSSIILPG